MCHQSKYLMGYFEFLDGSRIICLPFEYFKKTSLTTCLGKARRGGDSLPLYLIIRYNTHAPSWITTSTIQTYGNHHHFFIGLPILGIFHSDTNTILLTKPRSWLKQWNWFRCFSWLYFFQLWANIQQQANILGSHDSKEAM